MLNERERKEIIRFAKKQVAGNDHLHGMPHLEETASIALRLAKAENGDADVCWVASMLHDICRRKPGDHGAEGSKLASEFLLELNLPKDFVDKVREAIYFHNKDFNDAPVERKVLWDADKLPLMTPKGFRDRMLPYWMMKKGKVAGMKKAIEEYYFYKARFYTDTGRKEIEKHSEGMEN